METGKGESEARATVGAPPVGATKEDYDLHVLLIMRKDRVTKSKALLIAYQEGIAGLTNRLG